MGEEGWDDPLRWEEYTSGMNIFGEKLSEIRDKLKPVTESLEKVKESTKDMSKQMGTSRFKKSVKKVGGMFKSMMAASPRAYIISKLMETLSPLMGLFEVFQPILDAISALLSIMVSSAMKPLLKVITPLVDMIMSLAPSFEMLGGIIAELMMTIIEPFIEIFEEILPLLTPLIDAFADMLLLFKPLVPILVLGFLPVLMKFLPILITLLTYVIDFLNKSEFMKELMKELEIIIEAVNIAIDALIGWLEELWKELDVGKGGKKPTRKEVEQMSKEDQAKVIEQAYWDMYASTLSKIVGIPFGQHGGTTKGLTMAGEGGKAEEIIPLEQRSIVVERLDDLIFKFDQNLAETRKLVEAQTRNRGLKRGVYG